MESQIKFQLPELTIKSIRPLLYKGDTVFAYGLEMLWPSGHLTTIYENRGLHLIDYVGQKMECLLEITRGVIKFKYPGSDVPKSFHTVCYEWQKRLYECLPDLSSVAKQLSETNAANEDSVVESFELETEKYFNEWGLNGLQMDIYQAKPIVHSSEGSFLINEYQFEEEIDQLQLGEEFYLRIDEALLRGIRPCISPDIPLKQLQVLKQTEKNQLIAKPMPQPEPERKKGRSRFFID